MKTKKRKCHNLTFHESQSPPRRPECLRLSQHHSVSDSSSDTSKLPRLRRSICTSSESTENTDNNDQPHISYTPPKHSSGSVTATTSCTVEVPNAQPEKYNIPHTESSGAETEETYVDYRVTQIQGGGDNPNQPFSSPTPSVDGAYSLVAHSLKLSTV